LLDHAISLTGARRPKVCFVPTAVGDDPAAVASVAAVLADVDGSHLTLFPQPNVRDVRAFLLSQDLIWVGGGSVVNLLAVWRAHRLDEILRECWESSSAAAARAASAGTWAAPPTRSPTTLTR
jgi:peptidase E